MEFIGKNLPNIQAQFSSSLDTVKAGIQETARTAGLAGLESAFENFLPNTLGNQGSLDPQSWVGNVAQFSDPSTFFRAHTETENPEIATEQLLKYVSDPKFEPAAELESLLDRLFPQPGTFSEAKTPIQGEAERAHSHKPKVGGGEGVDRDLIDAFNQGNQDVPKSKFQALKEAPISGEKDIHPDIAKSKEGTIQGETTPSDNTKSIWQWMLDFEKEKEKQIEDKMNEMKAFGEFKKLPFTEFEGNTETRENSDTARARPLKETPIQGETLPTKLNLFLASKADKKQKELDAIGKKNFTKELPTLPYVEADGDSEGPRGKASEIASKDSAGSSSGADQRGIIIVGGTPEDAASQRGIIIVGGKTDGTYFQTIDDTIQELQTNPKQETLQLFGQQLGAVQDMTSTAKQAVLLQKQFTANSLSGKILS